MIPRKSKAHEIFHANHLKEVFWMLAKQKTCGVSQSGNYGDASGGKNTINQTANIPLANRKKTPEKENCFCLKMPYLSLLSPFGLLSSYVVDALRNGAFWQRPALRAQPLTSLSLLRTARPTWLSSPQSSVKWLDQKKRLSWRYTVRIEKNKWLKCFFI